MPSTGDIVKASDFDSLKPQLSIGTVTTSAAGTNASASITGTTPNFKLNLTIPRGNTGTTGPQGPSGVYTGPLMPTSDYWRLVTTTTTLPSGGTWAYIWFLGSVHSASVAAGGSLVGNNSAISSIFCWRIQ